jgi:hypothetical protein
VLGTLDGIPAVIYETREGMMVYSGEMPTRVPAPPMTTDLARSVFRGKYDPRDPETMERFGNLTSFEQAFDAAYGKVVRDRLRVADDNTLASLHHDVVARLLTERGFTPDVLASSIVQPRATLDTAKQFYASYADAITNLGRTNPRLAAELFEFATTDTDRVREAETAAGLPVGLNLRRLLAEDAPESFGRAFVEPRPFEVDAYFYMLRNKTGEMARTLTQHATQALRQQLPEHAELGRHLGPSLSPFLTVDDAGSTLAMVADLPLGGNIFAEDPHQLLQSPSDTTRTTESLATPEDAPRRLRQARSPSDATRAPASEPIVPTASPTPPAAPSGPDLFPTGP